MTAQQVLVVDDLAEWRDLLSDILREGGFEVDTAGSLTEAISRLNAKLYHLAIIDVRLEDRDEFNVEGMTILDEIDKNYGKIDAVAKLMMTAYDYPEQMRKAFKRHKVFDFIDKNHLHKDEFLTIVQEAFEKDVRINPDLQIVLEGGLTFESLIIGIARDGKRVKKDDAELGRLTIELEDLFRRLFYDYTQIIIRRVAIGHGRSGVVKVDPFKKDSHDETVIVKYGDYREIDREYRNWEEFVKGKIGTRTTNVLNLRRTPLLGGIAYSLIGTRVDRVEDFAEFWRLHSVNEIDAVLDDLFEGTCANWYADQGVVRYCALDKEYAEALRFNHEQLIEALKANFRHYLEQNTLTFRDLPGVAVPNPTYVTRGVTLSRPTYLCTTHGDLNPHNIFIDADGHTWLIDFYFTGKSHILRDCVLLESVVKYVLLEEGELVERYDLEAALASMSCFKEADSLRYDAPNDEFAKAFKVCRKLRQIARDLVHPNDDFSEYEIGLLYCSMNTQRFYSLPKVNRLHALLAAGMLCQKLGLTAT